MSHLEREEAKLWLTEAVLEFATIAGLFAIFFGLFVLLDAVKGAPV